MTENLDYLFVYGTLRSDTYSGSHRQLIAPYFSLVSRATMEGRLYAIIDYPGLVAVEEDIDPVIGEVYAFDGDESHLMDIDDFEGCAPHSPAPHLYSRSREQAHLKDGTIVDAWVYRYNFPVNENMLIRSGNFLDPF
jgi:gamma-glutamylcyclotransferase (GGCT)/AIG2-like uncharacterized protein YtfP